ncbi:MAG: hypothetical protein KAT30_10975, partial [Candidatus Krumholzibacteria bacterium]|nr:hypothetical protein [Candidatus Krumholzibacteria bacterium]
MPRFLDESESELQVGDTVRHRISHSVEGVRQENEVDQQVVVIETLPYVKIEAVLGRHVEALC